MFLFGTSPSSCGPGPSGGFAFGPVPFPFAVATYSFPPDSPCTNAIDIGIHSVGTNPSGSTMPSREALPVSLRVLITATASVAMSATYSRLPLCIQRNRQWLRAKIALPRKPRIKIALYRKLLPSNVHRCHRVAIRKRNIQRLAVWRQRERARMRSRLQWDFAGLSNASFRPTEFFSRSSSTISDAFQSATNARFPSFESCSAIG